MKHGPIDKVGTMAMQEAMAMLEITEALAPLSVEQREAVLMAAAARLHADQLQARAESMLRAPKVDSAAATVNHAPSEPAGACVTCGGTGFKDPRHSDLLCRDCGGTGGRP